VERYGTDVWEWEMRSCEKKWGRIGGWAYSDGRVVQVEGVSGGPLVGCGELGLVCVEKGGESKGGRGGGRE